MEARIPTPDPPQRRSLELTRRLLSLKDAAAVLGVSIATLRRLIWGGELPVVRLTRRIQVDVRDLDRLIDRRREGPAF
jgi:excisionase family DNA binding protein